MTAKETEKSGNQPNFYVYAVLPDEDGTRVGSRLGVVFNHKKGEGFTIYLDAQPIPKDGQIELVAFPPRP